MAKCYRISLGLVILFLIVGLSPIQVQARQSSESERAIEATKVLNEIMGTTETSIPEELMKRARGIAVIPHVVKAAFGIGGQGGKGVMSQRHDDGTWSAPAFVEIGGGSVGLQIGVQATDIVLVFTDDSGVRGLLKSKVKLGADASVAAGPVGRKAEVGTDVILRSGVLAYSRSKGLFAGISLDGSVVNIDDSANRKGYGRDITAEQILFGNTTASDPALQGFVKALQGYSPSYVKTTRPSTSSKND